MKKVAIIGASYLQLPVVKRAKELNIYTICFAWEDGAVCKDVADEFYPISITDKVAILEVCKKLNLDGVMTIASDVAVPTVNFVASELGLIANTEESGLYSTNKGRMREQFQKFNLNMPRFRTLNRDSDLAILTDLKFPLVIKPVDRSGSKGVTVVKEGGETLTNAIDRALDISYKKEVIVEEFIQGKEISVESFSVNGQHTVITITDKVTTGFPNFIEIEHHQPSVFSQIPHVKQAITNATKLGLDSLMIQYGASHAEFIITDDERVFVVEIGARMGGDFIGSDLVKLSTSIDYLEIAIKIALGEDLPPIKFTESDQHYAGVYFYTKITKDVKDFALTNPEHVVQSSFDAEVSDVLEASSDRSGYFIYQAQDKIQIK